jgi:hypothetical protein
VKKRKAFFKINKDRLFNLYRNQSLHKKSTVRLSRLIDKDRNNPFERLIAVGDFGASCLFNAFTLNKQEADITPTNSKGDQYWSEKHLKI